jgi:GNAT superfamily N-acetyltransferase
MLDIRQVSVDDFFDDPETDRLLSDYANECSIAGMPRPIPHAGSYHALESTGAFFIFGAYIDGKLIGFMSVVMPILPHYSVRTATMESFFVSPNHRKGGTGLKLIKHVEVFSAEQGAVGLLITAPADSRLEKMLSRFDYRHTNTVFFRKLA